jgi:hypothetical protein
MNILNDREKGFESKYALDEAREFRATARCNRMFGEWAAKRMGLENTHDYAEAVVKYHVEQANDEDVLRKVGQDLTGAGLTVRDAELRAKFDEFLAIARGEVETEG